MEVSAEIDDLLVISACSAVAGLSRVDVLQQLLSRAGLGIAFSTGRVGFAPEEERHPLVESHSLVDQRVV